jgi:hypothetical protein
LVEDLIGQSIASVTTPSDDIYLIHRDSVVSPDVSRAYFEAVAVMVRDHPDSSSYLEDASGSRVTTLGAAELETMANPAVIAAGYRVWSGPSRPDGSPMHSWPPSPRTH